MNHIHVERVLDILSERLTPEQVGIWMQMSFNELGGATPTACLAAGDVGSVVNLANKIAKRPVKAAPTGRPGEPLAEKVS